MYTITDFSPNIASSTNLWNPPGQDLSPMADTNHSNWPIPGIVKAVYCRELFSKGICQNPDVKSKVEKIVEPARPISPIHSFTSFIQYLSSKLF